MPLCIKKASSSWPLKFCPRAAQEHINMGSILGQNASEIVLLSTLQFESKLDGSSILSCYSRHNWPPLVNLRAAKHWTMQGRYEIRNHDACTWAPASGCCWVSYPDSTDDSVILCSLAVWSLNFRGRLCSLSRRLSMKNSHMESAWTRRRCSWRCQE